MAALEVEPGEVALAQPATAEQLTQFRENLRNSGFELLDNKRQPLLGRIKAAVVDLIHRHNA